MTSQSTNDHAHGEHDAPHSEHDHAPVDSDLGPGEEDLAEALEPDGSPTTDEVSGRVGDALKEVQDDVKGGTGEEG